MVSLRKSVEGRRIRRFVIYHMKGTYRRQKEREDIYLATEKEQVQVRELRNGSQTKKRDYSVRMRTQNTQRNGNGGRRRNGMRSGKPDIVPSNRQPRREQKKTPVRIVPLGGLNEIGKNMTVIECSNDMFILDCGLAFPDMDMPGVDIVIPDFTRGAWKDYQPWPVIDMEKVLHG